ncbi:MAG TPA: AsmA family protein [Steroidobacteraceae bacterium]|nr:AsmA family protein [Steroidobacteraceae bacterium]
MRRFASFYRHWLKWPLIAMAALFVLLVAVLLGGAALVDAGYLHKPILNLIIARTGHQVRVLGPVETHLLSLQPRFTAEHIVIHNPPWIPAGILAEIGRVSAGFEIPTLAEPLRFRRVELHGATFHLQRKASGDANWRLRPGRIGGKGPPLIRSFSMPGAQVALRDDRRHLQFDGEVSALEGTGRDAGRLRFEAAGRLNDRDMTLAVIADPLASARRDKPYHFRFEESSSGSTFAGQGELARPFDLREMQIAFEASGEDLKDVYFLVGLRLPDTGPYRVTGRVLRSGLHFTFADLSGKSGESDIRGTVKVDSTNERPRISADLDSNRLRKADLGKRAANRAPERSSDTLLLSDTPLRLSTMKRSDATVHYRARSVDLGKVVLDSAVMRVKIERGVMTVAPLTAKLPDGAVTGQLKFDASQELPTAQLTIDFDGLPLTPFGKPKDGQSPIDGLLRGRVQLAGQGHSLHQLAASANGTVTAILPHGEIRSALAEIAGIDFRGIGLLMTGDKQTTEVRCAVAAFEAHDGTLTANPFVFDTDRVLFTGEGTLNLATEALDFRFRGHPKRARLRLRTALTLHGTLAQPVVGLEAGSSLAQAGAGVALGVLLTPLAAVAAFIDPGRAKDADCAALIATTVTR